MQRLQALQLIQKAAAALEQGDGNLSTYEECVHRSALTLAFKVIHGEQAEKALRSAFLSGHAWAEDLPSSAGAGAAWNQDAKIHVADLWEVRFDG